MRADMHFHSICSDGSLNISELFNRAKNLGLQGAVLTDHDTYAGCEEFAKLCGKNNIKTVSGIEVSTFQDTEIHILGYNFGLSSTFESGILEFAKAREYRISAILQKLFKLGMNISEEEVSALSTVSRSRQHIARLMVQKKYVKSISEAMEIYLGENKLAWVDFYRVSPEQAVKLIRNAGGIAVLAHPGRLRLNEVKRTELVAKLVKEGLSGIETFYPTHTKNDIEFCQNLAKKYGLLKTTGSDFHNTTDEKPFDNYEIDKNVQFLFEV